MDNGNGYDQLDGDWLQYYKVAGPFTRKVKPEYREDFLHDLFLVFARVKAEYQAKGKELTVGGLVRISQYEVATYWRKWYQQNRGINCGQCSGTQRAKCKRDNLYPQCPKARQIESLDKLIEDEEGIKIELCQLVADDNAEFTDRLDAKLIVETYPKRFVDLAYKKYAGYRLTDTEAHYYYRELKKAQKKLVEVS